jgi:hypothetical protein
MPKRPGLRWSDQLPTKAGTISRLHRIAASLLLFAALGTCLARAADDQGVADRLAQAGVTPSLLDEGDAAANLAGGEKRGATYSGNLHVQLALDGDRLAGLPGWSGWLDVLWIHGGQAPGASSNLAAHCQRDRGARHVHRPQHSPDSEQNRQSSEPRDRRGNHQTRPSHLASSLVTTFYTFMPPSGLCRVGASHRSRTPLLW